MEHNQEELEKVGSAPINTDLLGNASEEVHTEVMREVVRTLRT